MILVDTSVWIDHLHRHNDRLTALLDVDEAGSHPVIVQELALGRIKNRATVLGLLDELFAFPVLQHAELLALVERRQLWGRGLSATDAHLLGAAALVPGASLWTADRRLRHAAVDVGVATI